MNVSYAKELTRRLAAADAGTLPDPSKITIAEYLRNWLDTDIDFSAKTKERYRELAELQIIPHLGNTLLQQLKPKQVGDWHKTILETGAKKVAVRFRRALWGTRTGCFAAPCR